MKILVVGGSIAGMGTALALSGPGREIIVLDRDSAPPDVEMNQVFDAWQRKGATQLRHGHGFTARFLNILRDRYPDLLTALMKAGARTATFEDTLAPSVRERYRSEPGDGEIRILLSRRTTLEFVMRDYVAKRPGVTFITDTRGSNIITEKSPGGIVAAKGMVIQKGDSAPEEMRADIIVDASGRNSTFRDRLAEQGVEPVVEEKPVGIVYFTRHYQFRSGRQMAWTPDTAGVRFDYFSLGVIPGDENNFVVMAMIPINEKVLRARIMHADVFDRVCATFPGVSEWTSHADATSQVLGMGDLKNVWVHWVKDGRPLIKDFFTIGDAAIRTNPAFGRGCSFAFIEAELLADALRESDDPIVRAKLYESKVEATMRPYFDQMVRQDEMIIRNARNAKDPAYRPSLAAKLIKSFADNAVGPAMHSDIVVRRAIMRGGQMLDPPTAWMKNPAVLARLLAIWAKPKHNKFYPPSADLGYDGLMTLVGST